jgi:hypothetical protein
MKVYIILENNSWTQTKIKGVYKSEESAKQALDKLSKSCWIEVSEVIE